MNYFENLLLRLQGASLSLVMATFIVLTSSAPPEVRASVLGSVASPSSQSDISANEYGVRSDMSAPLASIVTVSSKLESIAAELRRVRPAQTDAPDLARVRAGVGDLNPLRIGDNIRQIVAGLGDYESAVQVEWQAELEDMRQRGLDAELVERHRQGLQEFLARSAEFRSLLGPLNEGLARTSADQTSNSLITLADFFASMPSARAYAAIGDSARLPIQFSRADATPVPQESRASGKQAKAIHDPPGPAELAPTIDVELTPEIIALAQQLGGSPVAIRNWVYNNVEFTPTFGSAQGAALTLLNRRGNAHDTASLMIALLRASNIPSRYATSLVEMPVEKVQNWLQDVETPQMALDLMQKGGIPSAGVIVGGRMSAIRFVHVWVEAWIDYIPSRGAVNRVPDQWVPFDASFKQFVYEQTSNWREENLTDRHELMRQFVENFNVDSTGGISGLDFDRVFATMQVQATDLATDISATNPQVRGDFLYPKRSIVAIDDTIIAGTLPFPLRSTNIQRFAEIPAASRHQLKLAFYADETSLRFESPTRELLIPLPRIGNKKLVVDYAPGSAADAAAIAQYAESNAQSMPVGSLRVAARLKLGEEVLFQDGATRMGTQHFWTTDLRDVHGNETRTEAYRFAAGSTIVFVPNQAGISPERLERENAGLPDVALLPTVEGLYLGALAFWTISDHLADQAARSTGGRAMRMPSIGAFTQPLEVRYFFGVPRTGYVTGTVTDVKASRGALTLVDETQFKNVALHMGAGGSIAEGASWAMLSGTYSNDIGMSAASLIAQAIDEGQRLFQIDQNNVDVALQQLQLSSDAEAEIRQAVNHGQIAVAHEREISRRGWSGAGYVLFDPINGGSLQRVEGGFAGGIKVGCIVTAVLLKILCDRKFFKAAKKWIYRIAGQAAARLLASSTLLAFLGPVGAAAGIVLAIISAVQIAIAVAYATMEVARWVRSIMDGWDTLTPAELAELGINGLNDIACSYLPPCLGGGGFGGGGGGGGAGGPTRGNPTAVGTGAKWQTETDYEGNGRFPLRFVRSYTSAVPKSDSFVGAKWMATYFQRLRLPPDITGSVFPTNQRPDSVMLWRPEGGWFQFDWRSTAYVAESNIPGRLERLVAGGLTTGWKYTNTDDEVELFDAQGRLLSIIDRAGLTHTLEYDALQRPIRVTDAYGRQLQFAYDPDSGYLASVTDPRLRVISFEHAEEGQLIRVRYPDSTSREYHYEDLGAKFALTGITDERGIRTSSWTYDSLGRVKTAERAGGIERYQFDYTRNATKVIDPLGTERTYEYERIFDRYYLKNVTEPCSACGNGSTAAKTYDSRGLIASEQDFKGNRTTYQYEARGMLTSTTEAAGTPVQRTTSQTWDPNRHLVTRMVETIAGGNRTTDYTYDAAGNLTRRVVTANGQTRTWNFTWQNGLMTSEDGPRTDVADITTYTYDTQGNRATMTDPIGHVTRYTRYDANGLLLEMVDPNGLATEYFYDDRDRMVRVEVGPENSTTPEVTRYIYDDTGNLTRITLPDASFISYSYDGANRLTGMSDAAGHRVAYTLDGEGNRTATETFGSGNVLVAEESALYDALGRMQQHLGAENQITAYTYDDNGNEATVTDPLLHRTESEYDPLDRLVEVTDPDQNIIAYGYDAQDNLAQVTDPRGLITRYVYNGFDELMRQESPDTGATGHTYDPAGNLISRTDARGEVANYTYDRHNRLATVAYGDERLTYTFDDASIGGAGARSKLTRISSEPIGANSLAVPNTTDFRYDVHGRVIAKTQAIGAAPNAASTKTVAYRYDAQGRMDQATLPSGAVIGYQYGSDGRVLTITVNGQTLIREIEYFPFGEPKAWRYGSHRYERTFDADGRVRTHSLGQNARTISYDAASRITQIADPAGAQWSYDYDVLDRLTDATNAATLGSTSQHDYNYVYDATGNRTSEIFAIGAGAPSNTPYTIAPTSNRLTAVGANTRTFDAAGNTTRWTPELGSNTGQMLDASYGARNRWLETRRSGIAIQSHAYNPFGERVASWSIGAIAAASQTPETQFVYDEDGHLIGEYGPAADAAAATLAEHIWLGDTPVAVLTTATNTHQGLGIAANIATGSPARTVYFVNADHLDTPRGVVNANNLIVWYWNSAPYGDTDANERPSASNGVPGSLGSAQSFSYNLRFPGQRFDLALGSHYNYFRDYDPAVGGYLQSDPIGRDGGINLFAYVDGAPTIAFDPFGLHQNEKKWSNWACLYSLFYPDGCLSKTGISCNPCKRYSKKELAGRKMKKWIWLPRPLCLWIERKIVEYFPGPDNNEPWAGKPGKPKKPKKKKKCKGC